MVTGEAYEFFEYGAGRARYFALDILNAETGSINVVVVSVTSGLLDIAQSFVVDMMVFR